MAEAPGAKERERREARALSRVLLGEAAWLARAGHDAAAAERAARGLAWLTDLATAFAARRARDYFAALAVRTPAEGAFASAAWGALGAPFCSRLAAAAARGRGFDALDDDALDWEPHVVGVRAFEEPLPTPAPAPEPAVAPAHETTPAEPTPAPEAAPEPEAPTAIFLAVAAFAGEREPTFTRSSAHVEIAGVLPPGALDAGALAALDREARAVGAVVDARESDDGGLEWRVVVATAGTPRYVFLPRTSGSLALPIHRVVATPGSGEGWAFGHGLRRAWIAPQGDSLPVGLAIVGETQTIDGRLVPVVDLPDDAATAGWSIVGLTGPTAPAEPLQEPPVPADNRDDAGRPAEPTEPPSVPRRSAPRRALVADDSVMARVFLSRLLAAEGIAVEVAENGDEARAWLVAGGFDLAFLDVDMPGGGALEIVRTLPAAPLFVCALVKDDAERARVEAAGLGPALLKPFAEDEVRAALTAYRAKGEPNP